MKSLKILAVAVVAAIGLTGAAGFAFGQNAQGAEKSVGLFQAQQAVSADEEATGWLGVALVDLTPRLAQRIGVSITSGAVIMGVVRNSPAGKADLRRGDVITAVNGGNVANANEAKEALKNLKPGDVVTLSITNRSGSKDVQVTAEAKPTQPGPRPRPRARMPHPGMFMGPMAGLLPELREIPRDQLFDHTLGFVSRFTDKDGNLLTLRVVAGTVAASDSSNLTVDLNGGGQQQFSLDGEIRFLPRSASGGNIKVGDKVIVSEVNGQTKQVVDLDAARTEAESHMRGSGMGDFGGNGMGGFPHMFGKSDGMKGPRHDGGGR